MLVSIHSPYYPHSQLKIRSKSQLKSNGEKTQGDFNKGGVSRVPSSLMLLQASNDPVP